MTDDVFLHETPVCLEMVPDELRPDKIPFQVKPRESVSFAILLTDLA
jgi:hypothetical protein